MSNTFDSKNCILTAAAHNYCCSEIIVLHTRWIIAGVLTPLHISDLKLKWGRKYWSFNDEAFFCFYQDYFLLMHSCWMNTCIVVHSWHRMTLCYKFKQPGPPTPADVSGCKESETRPVWSEVCLCWCPGVYGRSPFDPRTESQRGKCLQHSLFSSVRRFFPVSSQCPIKNPKLTAMMHACCAQKHTICGVFQTKTSKNYLRKQFVSLKCYTQMQLNLPHVSTEMLAGFF